MEVSVLIPKIFNHPFTYKNKLNKKLITGDLVVVPFGKNFEIGVVWDKTELLNKKIKLKNIKEKIDNFSINKRLVAFINWFSMYNLVPKGLVLKMCIGNKNNLLKNKDELIVNNIVRNKFILNLSQKKSLKELSKFNKGFNVSVLQGVTGSGKTLVYFERIKKIIKDKKQALILLPEIFLTNQFKSRFTEYFGYEPAIWHSKITPKNKRKIWQGVIDKKI